MKKIEELKKIINFYVLANKLKTTIIDRDYIYPMNLVEYIPPIDKSIILKLKK